MIIYSNKKINLQIYYESLCPPSINAISLISSTIKILGGFEFVGTVNFVPFGFATVSGNRIVKCQHGEKECYGNRLHACANKLLPLNLANNFIACTIVKVTSYIDQNKGVFYRQIKDLCIIENKIDANKQSELEKCAEGHEIEDFMIKNYYKAFQDHNIHTTPHFIFNGLDNQVINLMIAHKPLIIFCDFLKEEKPKFCQLMEKNLSPKKNTQSSNQVKQNLNKNNNSNSKEGCSKKLPQK